MDLVVYYTRTNKTEEIAKTIKEEKNTDILQIKDKTKRNGIIKYLTSAIDSVRNKKTEIEYETKDLSSYDTIYIGTPVWASKPTPAIIKFIEENDFTNTNVVTFATMMGSGADATIEILNNMIKDKGGNVEKSFAIITRKDNIKELTLDALNN
ncbi:MAG: flavodoxin [Methanosphaera sp.]|nr:flavodoxin [Methanosphaera sp.]